MDAFGIRLMASVAAMALLCTVVVTIGWVAATFPQRESGSQAVGQQPSTAVRTITIAAPDIAMLRASAPVRPVTGSPVAHDNGPSQSAWSFAPSPENPRDLLYLAGWVHYRRGPRQPEGTPPPSTPTNP
jgi:hypothetical protein